MRRHKTRLNNSYYLYWPNGDTENEEHIVLETRQKGLDRQLSSWHRSVAALPADPGSSPSTYRTTQNCNSGFRGSDTYSGKTPTHGKFKKGRGQIVGCWWHTPALPKQRKTNLWVWGQPGLQRETLSQKRKIEITRQIVCGLGMEQNGWFYPATLVSVLIGPVSGHKTNAASTFVLFLTEQSCPSFRNHRRRVKQPQGKTPCPRLSRKRLCF